MRKIKLKNGGFTKVSDGDFDVLNRYSWYWSKPSTSQTSYVYGRVDGNRNVSMHRFIMGEPKGLIVDHKDLDGLNNQRENLRTCTLEQNLHNRRCQKNSSGYPYIGVVKYNNRWRAHIGVGGKKINLGLHDTKILAAEAYDVAAKEYFGELARLNFPET